MSFREALEIVAASGIFTTHTPVPAGIDVFSPDQMERYFATFRETFGLAREEFLDLGRVHPGRTDEPFNMAVLAIRTASVVNGVSRLHARISRAMWRDLWPGIPADEIPIAHVTNGVHPQSWISREMRAIYDSYLGPGWAEQSGDTRVWRRSEQIPTEELWRTHERRRERLVAFSRRRLALQLRSRGAGVTEVADAELTLDPKALTIGFGRRFATYKRATLLLRDLDRLERILNAPGRPVQIIFAGKAHPADDPGKELIRQVVQVARRPEFRRRIVFLEDYDQNVARYLVQGVDVWLNTPKRPLEASGTSGMKAAFNGALNLSILDGWWDEAYSPGTGWAIGQGEEYEDEEYRDRVESGALLDLLENEVVPLFYRRGPDNVPQGWTAFMRTAMTTLCPVFNTNRMVHEYVVTGYLRADERRARLEQDNFRRARELARWKERVRKGWALFRWCESRSRCPSTPESGERSTSGHGSAPARSRRTTLSRRSIWVSCTRVGISWNRRSCRWRCQGAIAGGDGVALPRRDSVPDKWHPWAHRARPAAPRRPRPSPRDRPHRLGVGRQHRVVRALIGGSSPRTPLADRWRRRRACRITTPHVAADGRHVSSFLDTRRHALVRDRRASP